MSVVSSLRDNFTGAARTPQEIAGNLAECFANGRIDPVRVENTYDITHHSTQRIQTTEWLNTDTGHFEVVAVYEYKNTGNPKEYFDGYRFDNRPDIQKGLYGSGFDATMAHLGLEKTEGSAPKPRTRQPV